MRQENISFRSFPKQAILSTKIKRRSRPWFLQISTEGIIGALWYYRRKWELCFRRRYNNEYHISSVNLLLGCDGTEKNISLEWLAQTETSLYSGTPNTNPWGYILFDPMHKQMLDRGCCGSSWVYCLHLPNHWKRAIHRVTFLLVRNLISGFEMGAFSSSTAVFLSSW